jgi:outer membrane protein insertion porin family
VKVTPETSTPETARPTTRPQRRRRPGIAQTAPLKVTYHIAEGPQLRVGALTLRATITSQRPSLTALLNTTPGQMLSPRNLAGDHDAIVTEYLSRGFDQAAVTVTQQPEPADSGKVDVVFHIDEGEQIFVRNVLLTGLEFTRPQTVARAITCTPAIRSTRTALADTQRNLYDFALFNEVNTAVENPDGAAPKRPCCCRRSKRGAGR